MSLNHRSNASTAALLISLVASLSGSAHGQQARAKSEIDCDKATEGSSIAYCASEDLSKADAELNGIYREIIKDIQGQSNMTANQRRDWERALREAQRHWLAFRDKDCGEVVGWESFHRAGQAAASFMCKAQKTWARTHELKERNGRNRTSGRGQ